MATINDTTYEILAPNPYDRGEFAGTPAGTWEVISDEEFDSYEDALAALRELQADGMGTLAIREVGARYPHNADIYVA